MSQQVTLDEVKQFVLTNGITIPNECWQTFMTFLGTQLQAISELCPNSRLVNTDLITKTNQCLDQKIPHYHELKTMIKKLNKHPHGVFDKPMYETYLVLAYLAYIHNQRDKLFAVMLSFAIFMLLIEFKQRFKICNADYMQLALTYMTKKAVYRKKELNHVEVVKYIVQDIVNNKEWYKHDDFVFRMMRLIHARITQNTRTLAKAYYKAAKEGKDSFTYGTTSQISTQSLMQSIMLHIDNAKSVIPSVKKQLSITMDESTLECVLESVTNEEIKQFITLLLHKDEAFRKLFLDVKTCSNIRKLYNKIFLSLHYLPEFDTFYQKLIKQCEKLTDFYKLQVRKVIAMIIAIAWKTSVCHS